MTVIDVPATHPANLAAPPTAATRDAASTAVVKTYYASATFWLLIASVLGFIVSIKLHTPGFLANSAYLTFGRLRPAHVNTALYGWACLAGIGTLLCMQSRLCGVRLPFPGLLIAGGVVWNVAVAGGTLAILCGAGTGVEYLEFPYAWSMIFAAVLGLIVVASLTMLAARQIRPLYVSQWYILAAVLWFPVLYLLANQVIHGGATHGISAATANWWFAHNLLGLWITPLALAAAFYLVPVLRGAPLYSHALSLFGFWTLAIFYNWAGMHHLIGGPVPRWLVTVSVVGSVLMLIPVIAVSVNLHGTLRGGFALLRENMALRFVVCGALSYTIVSVQGAIQALRSVNEVTHFTHYTVGHAHLGLYAFFTLTMFGAMYAILARLGPRPPLMPQLMRLHFWTCTVGVAVFWGALTIGGLIQGTRMNDADVPFPAIVTGTLPYLGARSIAAYLLLLAHLVFAVLLIGLLRRAHPAGEVRP